MAVIMVVGSRDVHRGGGFSRRSPTCPPTFPTHSQLSTRLKLTALAACRVSVSPLAARPLLPGASRPN